MTVSDRIFWFIEQVCLDNARVHLAFGCQFKLDGSEGLCQQK